MNQKEKEKSDKCSHIMITAFVTGGLSMIGQMACQWWGCYEISFINIFRGDLICNSCIDMSYHLKNHQIAIYGSLFALLSAQLTKFINNSIPIEIPTFADYSLGKNSPRKLNIKE